MTSDRTAPYFLLDRARVTGPEEVPTVPEPPSPPIDHGAVTVIGATTTLALRRRLQRLLQVPDSNEGSIFDGRLVASTVDPSDAVRSLKHVRLEPGLVLRGYQFLAGGNGNGFVFAVPASSHPADPWEDVRGRREVLPGVALPYPQPPDALPFFMDAIAGDGSPRAFFEASILVRELEEFGAIWHGCDWSLHELLCANPLAPGAKLTGEVRRVCDGRLDEWSWIAAEPAEWRPRVTVSEAGATVEFHSIRTMEQCVILRHTDTYRPGSMTPEPAHHVLAYGPIGGIC